MILFDLSLARRPGDWQDGARTILRMEPHDRHQSAPTTASATSVRSTAPIPSLLVGLFLAFFVGTKAAAAAELKPTAGNSPSAQLPELLELLKTNLVGATAEQLNRAAVAGLVEQLSPRVSLMSSDETNGIKELHPARGAAVTSTLHDRSFGYVRLASLKAETATAFSAAVGALASTNKLQGLVLDLRFCASTDYPAAIAVAEQFFGEARDLADWGEGMRRSTAKSNFLTLPATVLVNRQTSGAAEVLAGILRHSEAALLVGTNTAGQAGVAREFTLSTGHRVRVIVAPVKVAKGEELPFTGLDPDIDVPVDPQEEKLSLADAFRVIKSAGAGNSVESAATSTNSRPRRRLNEAELVRMAREGQDPRDTAGTLPAPKALEPAVAPAVTDPVLARALDILKALAVVQKVRGF